MSLTEAVARAAETAPIPDALTRLGVGFLVSRARRQLDAESPASEALFARDMTDFPIAEATDAANAQHYEVPAAFFALCLGARKKYSSCLYPTAATTLDEAEEVALAETCAHAGLTDGQAVLELGCGWGSLSLWMAEQYPKSRITAVSNSASHRQFIEGEALRKGLANLTVITADMNDFATDQRFDRIVSVEMFEHMANWRALLERVKGWLADDGRFFMHVFTHRNRPYRFDVSDPDNWIAQHFFTGGIMPSHGLIRHFPDLFDVEAEWRWSGEHYRRTAMDWLGNMDANGAAVDAVLKVTYGADWAVWKRRWRIFFLATAGLFGHQGGKVWGVSHYLLKKAAQ